MPGEISRSFEGRKDKQVPVPGWAKGGRVLDDVFAQRIPFYFEGQLFMQLLLDIEKAGNQKEYAKQLGISEQYLSDIAANRRGISSKIAKKMGYMKQSVYFKLER